MRCTVRLTVQPRDRAIEASRRVISEPVGGLPRRSVAEVLKAYSGCNIEVNRRHDAPRRVVTRWTRPPVLPGPRTAAEGRLSNACANSELLSFRVLGVLFNLRIRPRPGHRAGTPAASAGV